MSVDQSRYPDAGSGERVVPGQGEKLLVLVSAESDHRHLVEVGRQIAARRHRAWIVVWVDTGQAHLDADNVRLKATFSLAQALGAETAVLRGSDPLQTLVPYIERNHIDHVLVGAGGRARFKPFRKRLHQQLIDSMLPLEISVVRHPHTRRNLAMMTYRLIHQHDAIAGYGFALLAVLAAIVMAIPAEAWISNVNLALIFVLAVILTGLRHGSRPAIAAALLAFLSFNFFLTDPRYTFTFVVAKHSELFTLLSLLLIGLICGPAASRIRRQIILLREANRSSEILRLLAQELSVAEDTATAWQCVARRLTQTLEIDCSIAIAGNDGRLKLMPAPEIHLNEADRAAIDRSLSLCIGAGQCSDVVDSSGFSVFPVTRDDACVACAIIRCQPTRAGLEPGEETLVNAMLNQGADTGHRIQLAGELESARVRTEVEQLRSALLSSVSHDLKSPLAAMMGAAESLRLLDKQLNTDDREALLTTILQESRRLDSYIQNLLDMTRLEHGELKIERDWVSIADIVGSAIARLKRYFPTAITAYICHCQDPLLYAHAALVEQALFNLLENAAKYSPPGEKIVISVDAWEDYCVISVEDRGPGIPTNLREKVFDMFYMASDGDRKRGGTGMGLAICRGMIAAHAGTVNIVDSSDQVGTRVVIALPMNYPQLSAGESAEDGDIV